ncbi:MAG: FecR domain-containing protein [Pseudomonadota bacterium]
MTTLEQTHETEAHLWHARKADGLSVKERAEFDSWMAADPAHSEAFAHVEVLWGSLGLIDYPAVQTQTIDSPEPEPRAGWLETVRNALGANTPRIAAASLSVAILAALFFAIAPASLFEQAQPSRGQTYATNAAEQKNIRLPDGSSIILASQSELSVTLAEKERRVVLTSGSARFNVRSDRIRPFLVSTDVAQIRVVGTRFEASLADQGLEIGVSEGIVEVSQSAAPDRQSSQPIRLVAGDRIWTSNGIDMRDLASNSAAIPEPALPARSLSVGPGEPNPKRRVYSNASLAEIVSDLNEYADRPIVVMAGARDLTLSGSFDVSKPSAALQTIALSVPITVTQSNSGILIEAARIEPPASASDP